jgi:hypothetical protein
VVTFFFSRFQRSAPRKQHPESNTTDLQNKANAVAQFVSKQIGIPLTLAPLKGMGFLRDFALNIPITRVGGRNPFT